MGPQSAPSKEIQQDFRLVLPNTLESSRNMTTMIKVLVDVNMIEEHNKIKKELVAEKRK